MMNPPPKVPLIVILGAKEILPIQWQFLLSYINLWSSPHFYTPSLLSVGSVSIFILSPPPKKKINVVILEHSLMIEWLHRELHPWAYEICCQLCWSWPCSFPNIWVMYVCKTCIWPYSLCSGNKNRFSVRFSIYIYLLVYIWDNYD